MRCRGMSVAAVLVYSEPSSPGLMLPDGVRPRQDGQSDLEEREGGGEEGGGGRTGGAAEQCPCEEEEQERLVLGPYKGRASVGEWARRRASLVTEVG